ncbi:hypothetical protein JCM10296v2_006164 [Rhodotorula toruloides]
MQAWAFPSSSSDTASEPLWWAPSPLEGVLGQAGAAGTVVGPSTAVLPNARTPTDSLSPETRSPREPKRRTRSGCRACRERRVKCEEGPVGADGAKAACRKPQSERLENNVVKKRPSGDVPEPPVFPSCVVALRPAASQLAHPEYAVLETLAAGGDPARFIGSLSATSPSHDHFRSCMGPFLTRQFTCTSTSTAVYKPTDELTALYHAAVRIGYVSRLDGLEQAENHRLQAEEACQRAVSRRCRSEVLLIARALLALGSLLNGLPLDVPQDALVADITTPLCHQIYDILCVYRTLLALVDGTKRITTPVPLAGDLYLESTFGVARSMWVLVGKTIDLLVQRRTLGALPASMLGTLLHDEAAALLREGAETVQEVKASRARRIQQGTEMYNLMLSTLVHCEVLGVPLTDNRITDCRTHMLRIVNCTPTAEQLVGYNLPLTIATCYCPSPTARLELQVLRQSIGIRRYNIAPSALLVPDVTLAMMEERKAASTPVIEGEVGVVEREEETRMPWREACKSLGIDLLV